MTEDKNITRMVVLAMLLAALGGYPTPAAPVANPQAVADVDAGQRSEVRASWWGFDSQDATAALQSAINSGARRVIVENMGAPWFTDRLTLASNQELVFEKGVLVQAKRGAFRGGSDSLFSATFKTNITLRGPGATLRMWKQDYDDKTQYTHAEWRHVLSFLSCASIRVEGLTLADSGGDGIYLGVARKGVPCSDVVIGNVSCINNYRQGMSVISARNLLIENCTFKGTSGTAPEAGIDFEPNEPADELVNCVMRNCTSDHNRGDAYTFYLRQLRADSKPVSIRLENCRSVGCRRSAAFVTGNDSETAAVKGMMEFVGCQFEGSQQAAVVIGDKPATGVRVSFVHCQIIHPAANQLTTTPIVFTTDADGAGAIGGVVFDRCTIRDALERLPMSYQDMSGVGLTDITGTLTLERGGDRILHSLTPQLLREWMPVRSFKHFTRVDPKAYRYEPALPDAKLNPAQHTPARQRELSHWLLWSEGGEQVSFSVLVQRVGKGDPKPVPVSITSPSGQATKLRVAYGEKETAYQFHATERGAYKIICEPQSWTATVSSPGHRVCLTSRNALFHLLGTTGRFWFWVPPGTKEFGMKVSGGGGIERVKVVLCDPAGARIDEKDNIDQACQFLAEPKDASRGEIWSVRLDKPTTGVLEDFYIELQGIPPLLAPSREDLLRPAD